MADRSRLLLPAEFASEVTDAGLRVDAALPTDFGEAADAAREELRLLRAAEAVSGRDLHKGHPLYNLGVTLYPRQPAEARRHFEAAFVEDVRTYKAPRQRLAARVVRDLLKAPRRLLRELTRRAMPDARRDPLEVADEVDSDFDLPTYAPLFPETQPDDWLLGPGLTTLEHENGSCGQR